MSAQDERVVDTFGDISRGVSTSPGALLASVTATINAAANSGLLGQQRSPNNLLNNNAVACAAAAAAAAANNSKRYRTHLTPLQVFVCLY